MEKSAKARKKFFMKRKYASEAQGKSPRNLELTPDLKGILATTVSGKEGLAVRELYNVLELIDTICEDRDEVEIESHNNDQDLDINELIKKEVEALKNYKFHSHKTKIKNVVFISIPKTSCVNHYTQRIFEELENSNKDFALKNCLRIIPIKYTTKTNIQCMEKMISQLVNENFDENSDELLNHKTYSIFAKVSFNNEFNKQKLKETFFELIKKTGSTYKLDYKLGHFTIFAQIIRNICMVGVLKDYEKNRKYNVEMYTRKENISEKSESNVEKYDTS